MTSISNSPSAGAAVNFNYAYNSANQRTSVTNADSSRWVYQYDSLGQVVSGKKYWSDGKPVAGQQFEYGFDDIGNRKFAAAGGNEWGANLRYANYTANNVNQYTQRTIPGAVDVIGVATNTATVTANNVSTSRKGEYFRAEVPISNATAIVYQPITNIAALNQGTNNDIVTNIVGSLLMPKTPQAFSYDADGNLTNDGVWSYTWDAENRLIQIEALSGVPDAAKVKLVFGYDWQGRRIRKQRYDWISGSYSLVNDQKYLYEGWNSIARLDSGNGFEQTYAWGLDLSGSMQGAGLPGQSQATAGGVGGLLWVTEWLGDSGGTHFAGYDGNGNVAVLVKGADGTVAGQYEYDPFGQTLRVTGPMAKENSFRFSTKYQDDETGLLYYGFRYYDQSTGHWFGRDPIAEKGGLNLYGFVNNDPLDKLDASGLQIWTWTTIDQAINTCLAGPNPAACLAELLEDADLTAAQRAIIKGLMEKAKRIGTCYVIHKEYTEAEEQGKGCVAGLTCAEYKQKVAAITLEVGGRTAWIARRCDYVCPGSVNSKAGANKKEAGHVIELAEKSAYLTKCGLLMKAACGESN